MADIGTDSLAVDDLAIAPVGGHYTWIDGTGLYRADQAGVIVSCFHADNAPSVPVFAAYAEYMAVAPDGALFPCHQFAGIEEFRIGNVFQGILRDDIGKTFQKNHVLSKPACRGCWARFYCGGGCHANAWRQNGRLSQPYEIGCILERKRLECALFLQVMLYEEI
jgi:radical SAM protein with 4Fe4S-binding SPASM domain